MVWVRKGIVHLLSLILLLSLLGAVFAFSINTNLSHPDKLKLWLQQSGFYSSLVNDQLTKAQQSASNDTGAGRVSLSDPAVEQAIKSVLSPELLQGYAGTFLDSNYAWLEGKTSTPQFTINLAPTKNTLAQQLGQLVKTRVASLPSCSAAQLVELESTLNSDPLAIPCRPPTLTADTAATQVTDQINSSQDFLKNTSLTAHNLDPNGSSHKQAYYAKLSSLPKLYRLNLKLPWMLGIVALVTIIGIVFISPRRRRGVRRVGWVVLIAGILLVAVKLVADKVFNRAESKLLSHSNLDQLQQSLTGVLRQLETQLTKVDVRFGVCFVVIGVVILLIAYFVRRPSKSQMTPPASSEPSESESTTGASQEQPSFKETSRPPKRPRLIQ